MILNLKQKNMLKKEKNKSDFYQLLFTFKIERIDEKMSKKNKREAMYFMLPAETKQNIIYIAKKNDITKTDTIRLLVDDYLERKSMQAIFKKELVKIEKKVNNIENDTTRLLSSVENTSLTNQSFY